VNTVTNATANIAVTIVEADLVASGGPSSSVFSADLPGGSATTQVLYGPVPFGTHISTLNTYFSTNQPGGGGGSGISCTNTSGGSVVVTAYYVPYGYSTSSPPSWTQIAAAATVTASSTSIIQVSGGVLGDGGSVVLTYSAAATAGTFGCHASFLSDTGNH
jgi:hypothetical protein